MSRPSKQTLSPSITASPVGQAVILLIMYVETFKTDIIVLNVT
jgi:hypothetical protein